MRTRRLPWPAAVVPAAFLLAPAAEPQPRSVVFAPHGMVAAAHPLAAGIGLDVLKKGGSAVDAAIAVNAALGLMEPVSCGIGGDLFALVWDPKTASLHGLDASGRAPFDLTAEKIPAAPDGTIPLHSPYAWTVPGAVDGWATLHARFGRLPLAELLAPSIAFAREGVPVPRVIAGAWERGGRLFRDKPGFAEVFLPGGSAQREGALFRNPALARAYEAIAREGRDAFYRGPIARGIVAYSRAQGGFLSERDLAQHRSTWVTPISTTYRGVTVWEIPPPGQGIAALQMLNLLEGFDLRAMGRDSADFWHTLVEVKKLAFEDRARWIGERDTPVEGLLSKRYAAERVRHLDRARASTRIEPGSHSRGTDTTYLAVADKDGMMVSLIQSNYTGFGSGYVVKEWGFGLQNRGSQFSLDPASPNVVEPGKRPFHTIIPAFATREGKPWLAFGVMGGDMQPQGHVQVLVNLVDFGMDLQAAGDAARFHHGGSSEPTGTRMTDGGVLHLEAGVPAAVRAALVARGHRVEDAPPSAYGGYQAIARDPVTGVYAGATESRKDGCALGY
jgi:gamma-glutamyltranspeptidase/glutathione hydrolase